MELLNNTAALPVESIASLGSCCCIPLSLSSQLPEVIDAVALAKHALTGLQMLQFQHQAARAGCRMHLP